MELWSLSVPVQGDTRLAPEEKASTGSGKPTEIERFPSLEVVNALISDW